jgi:CRP-like cAMP-binding protein
LRAFLKFAARRDITALHVVERALAVPMKRYEGPMLGVLTREEMVALLGLLRPTLISTNQPKPFEAETREMSRAARGRT